MSRLNLPKYRHLQIKYQVGLGYWAANGVDQLGYCETLEEIKREIDDYWQESRHGEFNGFSTIKGHLP